MSEDEVLNLVLKVFDYVLKKHEGKGRHELNRTDITEAIGELRLIGLPVAPPSDASRIANIKAGI